jgi:hypothetical protein
MIHKKHSKALIFLVIIGLLLLISINITKEDEKEAIHVTFDAVNRIEIKLVSEKDMPSGRAYTIQMTNKSNMTIKQNVLYLSFPLISADGKRESTDPFKIKTTGNRLDILPSDTVNLHAYIPLEAMPDEIFTEGLQPYMEIVGYFEEVTENTRFIKSGPLEVSEHYTEEKEVNLLSENSDEANLKEDNYTLSKLTYLEEDENNQVTIEYPVVIGLSYKRVEDDINTLIEDQARQVLSGYDYEDRGKLTLDITYQIALSTPDTLSINYSGLGYIEGAAHPNKIFYTTNIDIRTGERLHLVDLVTIDDDFVSSFINGAFKYAGPLKSEYKDDIFINNDLDDFINADHNNGIYSYLTEDSLGISLPVAYALGGYALYEIPYENEVIQMIRK